MASNSEVLDPGYRAQALANPYVLAQPYDCKGLSKGLRWHGLVFFLLMGAAIVAGAASTAW